MVAVEEMSVGLEYVQLLLRVYFVHDMIFML